MQRTIARRLLTLLIAIALGASACSATAEVTITPGLVEQAAASELDDATTAGDRTASEAADEPDAAPASGITSTAAATPGAAIATASATATSANAQADLTDEQAEKAERRAAYDQFRRDLNILLVDPEPRLETEHLPDQAILADAKTGETMRTTTTVELADGEDPIVFTAQSHATAGVTHTVADRVDYARFLEARFGHDSGAADAEPGPVETVAIINGGYTTWSRGLSPEIARTAYAPLDPNRWYVADVLSSAVRPFHGTTSELWERLDTEMPDGVFDEDGTSTRTAVLAEPGGIRLLGFANGNTDAAGVTVTTVTDASDLLVAIVVDFPAGDAVAQVQVEMTDHGVPLDLPTISDVLQDPRDGKHISADSYSWSATGTTFEAAGDLEDSRWNVQGHYADAYLNDILTITAADAAVMAGVELVQSPPDQLIQRKGFEGTTYTVGLIPEILPAWAYPEVDAGAEYFNDVFGVPTHLFPMGLSEMDLWASLRTLPTITDRRGWTNARVTTGSVDPEYWNWRHREGEGFFAWIVSEDPAEKFDVTIGADADGRAERVEIRTLDPDGGGLRFDITIDQVKTEPPVVEVTSRPNSFTVDPAWSEATAAAEESDDGPSIGDFFEASRAAYPTIEHARRPEHLTLLATRVKDEPSGAYTPDGEYYRWPSVYFGDLVVGSLGDTGQMIVCLELEDNEWRYADNNFEKFWRGYADGSSLDGLTLRYNANAWLSVDVYGSDGDRHPGDPCASAGAW